MVAWLRENVTELALVSCKPVHQQIIDRGDHSHLKVSFDGFYLTRGHHSNNSSTTVRASDMLSGLLTKAKSEEFVISQLVMDHDTSSSNIACEHFPKITITYCGNYTAKTFHNDLIKI